MSFGLIFAATKAIPSLAQVSLASSVIGGGLSAFGAYQQGQAAKDSAKYQAAIADRNAALEKQRQQQITDQSDARRVELARRTLLARGQGRTAFAANNVDLGGGGAPLQWEIALDRQQQYESNLITNNERTGIFDSQVRAGNDAANASALRATGDNQFTAGLLSAGGSLIGTAGLVSDRYIRYRREGVVF